MKYSRLDYENFLNTELETQQRAYGELVMTKAITLKEQGKVFVGRFIKLQENGMAIFKVRISDKMPRKNSFWTASYLIGDMGSYRNWADNSWASLRENYQGDFSEALCAWISKSEDSEFCLIGIKNLTLGFAQKLEREKPIIAFGPKDPPLKYLMNLIDIVRDNDCKGTASILDFSLANTSYWYPQKVDSTENLSERLLEELKTKDEISIQGPPGTGKTYRMASLASKLLTENKSVLVTALTNQALMELAEKEDLVPFVNAGKVTKTSMTVDEHKRLPHLLQNQENKCDAAEGKLSLASFYVASGWAKDHNEIPFDYAIMDEASQALLPMISAMKKLGKKVIWVGDQNQLAPIVETEEKLIVDFGWSYIIKGFNTLCDNFQYPDYMLCDTFRLTGRSAECTGVFYNNSLKSVSRVKEIVSSIELFNKNGGPTFYGMDLKIGEKSPDNAISFICNLVHKIIAENPKASIAVLSKFRDTVRDLQKAYVISSSTREIPDSIRIETVDRVQGLTVDYCIYLIPNASTRFSLEKELFNVATSRSTGCTVIIADQKLLRNDMAEEVRKYLLKAQDDKFVTFNEPPKSEPGGLKVIGKIDLSQFEKKKREIVPNKENIFIIDTNVFVNCPDIISRIGRKYKIVIPAKVLEELDKLKLKPSIDKKNLNEAAKNINTAFVNSFSSMEEGDVNLLPNGFDRNNPDCMILSVALKYKGENPILLTSDNVLQSRASALGITTISLREFLQERRS